ncbi:MAG: hypothetical protein QOH43_3920 [Solirubrobacteraceae bacterium]|nr:hypothetical protein [Solirubrobacteraceae bacterium]
MVRVGTPGRLIAPSFLGMSVEWDTLAAWLGQDPVGADQAVGRMWSLLATDGAPVLRIGGNSADRTWIGPGPPPPQGIQHVLTPGTLAAFGAVLRAHPARVVLGLDLAHRRFAADARVLALARRMLPARDLRGAEIGNEPDLYPTQPWGRAPSGAPLPARDPQYGVRAFLRDYRAALRALHRPLRGLALAGPGLGGPHWAHRTAEILRGAPQIDVVAAHEYALSRCAHRARPTLARLLAPKAARRFVDGIRAEQRAARARGLPLRLQEGGSVACRGAPGVSDAPASALWALRLFFTLAGHGVSGIDLHNAQGAYDQLVVRRVGEGWAVHAQPTFVAMLAFAHTLHGRTRLLHTSRVKGVGTWATRDATGTTHVVLVNDAPVARDVLVATGGRPAAALLRLVPGRRTAFGGRAFPAWSTDGRLPSARPLRLVARRGRVAVRLRPRSAAVVDLAAGRALARAQKSRRPARCSAACGRDSS